MEMILYDVVLLKLFCVQINFFKSYPYCFYSLPEIETIRPFVYMSSVLPRPFLQGATPCPFLVTPWGDSSVFVLSRTGHFEYSPVHNSVNINGRNFILHLHGSCHMCVSMCDQHFFVNYFNWLIYP